MQTMVNQLGPGPQVPGSVGGLASPSGLTVAQSPLSSAMSSVNNTAQDAAQHTQSFGRGQDSMLVHMTPNEVNSLRGLAQQFGGDLTVNPNTGLPEAGWLGDLLPSILGIAGSFLFPGVAPWIWGLGGAAAGTAVTGDLQKGLMAGLGAFGGASLGGAIKGATGAAASGAGGEIVSGAQAAADVTTGIGAGTAATTAPAATTGGGILGKFGNVAKTGLSGTLAKAAPFAAGLGLLNTVSNLGATSQPQAQEEKSNYKGPYKFGDRPATFAPSTQDLLNSSAERTYFANSQPALYDNSGSVYLPGSGGATPNATTPSGFNLPRNFLADIVQRRKDEMERQANPPVVTPSSRWRGYAGGGMMDLQQGSFIMPAREVAEFGNGSSGAGQEVLAQLGGVPITGPGDGVSDSIPARMARGGQARVARDEVYFPPQAVKRAGGAKNLYKLMGRAQAARKSAGRGANTKLAKGLGSL